MGCYGSPRWTGEIEDCSMPMTFDTYSNCSFGCLYCFSQYQRGLGKAKDRYIHKTDIAHVSVERVKRMFHDPDQYAGQFAPYIKERKTMQWGGLSDQFDGNERRHGVTLELLRFFKEIDYPLCFSTKAVWWTEDERYMELFRGQKNWNVKFSIITLDERKARIMEEGVPTPEERLKAIGRIAEAGAGGATLRLRPFIIGISTPSYLELIREAGQRGAGALSTEFLCLEERSELLRHQLPVFTELCGFDIYGFYREYSTTRGYMRLNRKVKEPFVDRMEETCREAGMRFYVSDAHFKERCANGSCCGLPPDWNYSHGQFCEALNLCRRNGSVRWRDIAEDVERLHGYPWRRASGYNTGGAVKRARNYGLTMADYLKHQWNSPASGHSPYRLFDGAMIPEGRDEDGNIIYHYNKDIERKS